MTVVAAALLSCQHDVFEYTLSEIGGMLLHPRNKLLQVLES